MVVCQLKIISTTKKLINYIQENQISIKQTSLDVGISEEKLRGESEESLTAVEFLDLCSYLGIRPEEL